MKQIVKIIGCVWLLINLPTVCAFSQVNFQDEQGVNYKKQLDAKIADYAQGTLKEKMSDLSALLKKAVDTEGLVAVRSKIEAVRAVIVEKDKDKAKKAKDNKPVEPCCGSVETYINELSHFIDVSQKKDPQSVPLVVNPTVLVPPVPTNEAIIKNLNTQLKAEESDSFMYKIIAALLAVALGIAVYFANKFNKSFDVQKKETQRLKEDLYKLEHKVGTLNQDIQNKERERLRLEQDRVVVQNTPKNVVELDPTPPPQAVVLEPFYFSSPSKDSTFKDSNRTAHFKLGHSIYQFSPQSETKATFSFINDASNVHDALNYPETLLLPVCRADNDRNPRATAIETKTPGIAELEGDKWVVKQPALIRYA